MHAVRQLGVVAGLRERRRTEVLQAALQRRPHRLRWVLQLQMLYSVGAVLMLLWELPPLSTVESPTWPTPRAARASAMTVYCCTCAAVKQGAKVAGRVYQAPFNHVGRAPPQQCFTFEGPTRFGAVVLTRLAGFNPKLVRQAGRIEEPQQLDAEVALCAARSTLQTSGRQHAIATVLQQRGCVWTAMFIFKCNVACRWWGPVCGSQACGPRRVLAAEGLPPGTGPRTTPWQSALRIRGGALGSLPSSGWVVHQMCMECVDCAKMPVVHSSAGCIQHLAASLTQRSSSQRSIHISLCCRQVEGFYHLKGRNLCFEGAVRVCKIGKNSKGEPKLFAPKSDGTTYIAGENGIDFGEQLP